MGLTISEKHALKIKKVKREENDDSANVEITDRPQKITKKDTSNNELKESDGDDHEEENCDDEDEEENDDDEDSYTCSDENVDFPSLSMSYTGVHEMRKSLIEMVLKFLTNNPTSCSDICIGELEKWTYPGESFMIPLLRYDEIHHSMQSKINVFRKCDLSGIFPFVNHSDADGYLSPGEVLDLKFLLKKLSHYKTESEWWFDELSSLVDVCVERQRGFSFH